MENLSTKTIKLNQTQSVLSSHLNLFIQSFSDLLSPFEFNGNFVLSDAISRPLLDQLHALDMDDQAQVMVYIKETRTSDEITIAKQMFQGVLIKEYDAVNKLRKELLKKMGISFIAGSILVVLLFLLDYSLGKSIENSIVIELAKVGCWMFLWTGLYTVVFDYFPAKKTQNKIKKITENLKVMSVNHKEEI